MDFLDRIEEIAELRRVLDSKKTAKFIVVFGRRRLGKSTLLKKILEKSDVYYMASDLVTNIQINMLQDQLAVKYPEIGRGEYQSWEDLLLVLNSLTKSKFTLCLDEFPYMVKHSPELPSLLQRLIDSKGLNYNLIICGSSQRMMQELVLSKAEPLYGRADAIINLQPIPPVWLQEALHLSGRETVEEYSVWGGVPRYWELREEYDNLMEAIAHTMISTTADLYDEPKPLFLDD
ncbi:MAG: ATP-binding protein, partial [Muribaculaceae bacterium]|nr:ATP-binding protein [Muribaculaceae bacterium]